jgi:xylulokinase
MALLGLDCGSSSIKAAVLGGPSTPRRIARGSYKTHFDGVRAEIDPRQVLKALAHAIHQLGPAAKRVDHIALDVMAPSWVAMDARGKPLTPIITHQDRRSVEVALELERKVGKARHLRLSGNRPFPGGISSTTWAWFVRNQPAVLKKADLVGHLSTFLHRTLTGARVTDPSNASFMGLYNTLTLKGWNQELCQATGADMHLLPEVHDGNVIAGKVTAEAARRFGLTQGTPVLVGVIDTSATLLLRGAKVGQLLNVAGSTDVLALCTDHPKPDPRLLTRAVGVGRRWMQVSTLAAAGSTFAWVNRELFEEMSPTRFYKVMDQLAARPLQTSVRFEPYLAGERTSVEQRSAAFTGITLATTRRELLGAVVEAIATASAARFPLLRKTGTRMGRDVLLSGGLQATMEKVLHRDWPGRWRFHREDEATLRGLAKLKPLPR